MCNFTTGSGEKRVKSEPRGWSIQDCASSLRIFNTHPLSDRGGGGGVPYAPSQPNNLHFHAVLKKNWPNEWLHLYFSENR